jgi:hypothetical protein
LAVLSGCSARIHDGGTIWYDEGGRVDTYEAWAQESKRIAGTCISACTIYLRTGCVEPGATLVFHPPGFPTFEPPAVHDYWAERIASSYPLEIAAWYLSEYGTTRDKSGAWAISKGARQCR